MDFGRISLRSDLVLYLFGTPGQQRFWFMWDELAIGALGAVVLADTRRLADSFPAIDYFERRAIPFIVALNCFDGARRYDREDVRMALDLDPDMPIVLCDARSRESAKDVLITLVEHVLMTAPEERLRAIRGIGRRVNRVTAVSARMVPGRRPAAVVRWPSRAARPRPPCRVRRWDSSPTRGSARRRSAGRARFRRPSRAAGAPASRCPDRPRPA